MSFQSTPVLPSHGVVAPTVSPVGLLQRRIVVREGVERTCSDRQEQDVRVYRNQNQKDASVAANAFADAPSLETLMSAKHCWQLSNSPMNFSDPCVTLVGDGSRSRMSVNPGNTSQCVVYLEGACLGSTKTWMSKYVVRVFACVFGLECVFVCKNVLTCVRYRHDVSPRVAACRCAWFRAGSPTWADHSGSTRCS